MSASTSPLAPRKHVAAATHAPTAAPGLETVRAKVTELIPAYHTVHLETDEGRGLALTAKTGGIDLASLRVGQTVECVVTLVQPRVIQAHAIV
jgi:hypothetical protein